MIDVVIRALAHVLVPLFLVGMAGSAIIVVMTLISDFTDFLSDSGNEDTPGESLS